MAESNIQYSGWYILDFKVVVVFTVHGGGMNERYQLNGLYTHLNEPNPLGNEEEEVSKYGRKKTLVATCK